MLDEQTFYGFIAGSESFKRPGSAHREIFGQVGFGTGGWDTDFPNSILEILRVVYTDADDHAPGHRRRRAAAPARHCGSTSRRAWSTGRRARRWRRCTPAPRGAVDRIARDGSGDFRIRERWGREAGLPGGGHHLPVLAAVHADPLRRGAVPGRLWTAIERTHYMESSKTFVMVDRPFWKDIDPATGREVMSMTLTDRLNRGTYLLDDGPDKPAVICCPTPGTTTR